jgi:predicted naringenin-chalcone synthase
MLGDNVTWSNLFWAVHPGGRSILDNIDTMLKLDLLLEIISGMTR